MVPLPTVLSPLAFEPPLLLLLLLLSIQLPLVPLYLVPYSLLNNSTNVSQALSEVDIWCVYITNNG